MRTDERSPKPVVTPYTTVPSATIASTVSRPRTSRALAVGRERRRRAAAGDALELGEGEAGHADPWYGCLVASRAVTDAPVIRAPRGSELSCKGWLQEAALRMLMNNLDPEVAEDPANLVVYGGTGRAARSWEAFHAIVATLRRLENDETLLVQSGKPVGVFRTHEMAPRVLIANSLLVPDWADWETFRRLEAEGLTMYGQMTAGSWIYIGTQGILQGTFETFAAVARKRFDGTLRGRVVLTAGCGGMGGAQPLAVTMLDGVCLVVDVDAHRLERRVETRYLDLVAPDLDAALREAEEARAAGDGRSIGIVGSAGEVFRALLERGVVPDIVTDQTSAHDPLGGYVPDGLSLDDAAELRESDPQRYIELSRASMAAHCAAMVEFQERGAEVFDYGNSLRAEARTGGFDAGLRVPRLRRGLRAAALLHRHGPVPLGRALGRSRRHRGDRRRRGRALPRATRTCSAGSSWRARASPSRACRRASAGSATASATARACASTSSCARAR